jgi:hypothetical protein
MNSQHFNLALDPISEKRHLFGVKVTIPYSRQELMEELEQEDWRPFGATSEVDINHWPGKRFKVLQPRISNKKLWEVFRFFCSQELKRQLIHALYDRLPEFPTWWGWYPDSMFEHCHIHGEFTKDLPGFVNDIHTDYRLLVATGMVYWCEQDDARLSSFFWDDLSRSNATRMTTGFGDGWFHANSNNSWHGGCNETDQIRYSSLLALTVNVAPVPHR